MQRRILVFLGLAGAIAGLALLLYLLNQESPGPELPRIEQPPAHVPAPVQDDLRAEPQHGTLKGKVIDGLTEEPLGGARVTALVPYLEPARSKDDVPTWGNLQEKAHVFSAEDGTFALEELPPDFWNLWVEKKGYSWTTVPRAKFDRTHVIKLYPACSIHGKVVYEDGSPAQGIRIMYTPQGTHSEVFSRYKQQLFYTATGPDGTFEYTELPPGKFTVEVFPEDYLPAPWRYEPPLKPGENRDLGTKKLDRGFGMTVKVLYRGTNEPVEGVEVVVRPIGDPEPRTKTGRRKRTNAQGIARFSGLGGQALDEPQFLVAANLPEGPVMPDRAGFFGPNETVVLYLRKAGVIKGRVNRPGGDPLELFWVDVEPQGFQTRQLRMRGEDGKFEMVQVPEGRYRVRIRYGNLVERSVEATVVGGETTDIGTVTLEEGAEIYGTVRTSDGSELEELVRVHLARKVKDALGREAYETVKRAYVRKDGSYRLKGLAPGTYWIWPSGDVASPTTKELPVEVPPGTGAIRKDLVIHGVGHLDLQFVDLVEGSRRRVVAPPVWLVHRGSGEEARWWANGTPLRGGRYDVYVELPDEEGVSQRYKAAEIEIQEGETTGPIEIRLFEIRDGGQQQR